MLTTRFTELVGCNFPLQQAGMGGVATRELAGAVADAGALGTVAAARLPPEFLADQLDQLRQQTRGVFGVNFLMPFLNVESVKVAAARARVVEFFYGDPDPALIALVQQGGALACWQVGSEEEALAACQAGCDFLIVQGTEAGGHVRGHIALLPLLTHVLERVDIPVVAAGGIGNARSVAAVMAAGADAVRIGTRFVTAAESNAHPAYKDALVKAKAGETVLTEAFSVMWPNAPHRVLRSCVEAAQALSEEVVGETIIAGNKLVLPRFAVPAPSRAATGKIEAMALYAGEAVGDVTGGQTAREIIHELMEGAERLLRRWAS